MSKLLDKAIKLLLKESTK
ncbi:hypothetical protein [Clostridium paraputrificum]